MASSTTVSGSSILTSNLRSIRCWTRSVRANGKSAAAWDAHLDTIERKGKPKTIAPDELIYLLVDIVSKNGNLLLDVGPEADGTIPPVQMSRLEALGSWLRQNGEAIYGTHPWKRAEGETIEGIHVRFTQRGPATYAI